MGFHIPDPRFEMPELLIPRRKPTGRTVVDWSHPTARGCIGFWYFGIGDGKAVDVARGNHGDYEESLVVTPQYIDLDGTHDRVRVPHADILDPAHITVITRIKPDDTIGTAEFVRKGNNSGVEAYSFLTIGTDCRFYVYTGGFQYAGGITLTTNWQTLAGTYDGSTIISYLDGTQAGTQANTGDITGDPDSDLMFGARPGSTVDRFFGGLIEYVVLFDRALSAGEVKSMYQNPYQFLIPA